MELNHETIKAILESVGIDDDIIALGVTNQWIMESRRIYLSNGRVLLLRIGINDEWTDDANIHNQICASRMLRDIGIPQPDILAFAENKDDYGFRFLLSDVHRGLKLLNLYRSADPDNRIRLFESLARTYSCIYSRKNSWSGVWNGSPEQSKYPIHPARFYSMAEINGGSGLALYSKGAISKSLFDALCNAWDSNLAFLEQREASFVHMSPFPWSIYLSQTDNNFNVTGLTALGDFMWWDAMSDVAHLLYPPFMDITDTEREAFLKYYSEPLDFKAISLYRLLNRICAVSGVYMAPVYEGMQAEWRSNEIPKLSSLADNIANEVFV